MNGITLTSVLAAGAGGFVGSTLRYLIHASVPRDGASALPVATLIVNVVGCGLIGAATAHLVDRPGISDELRLFLVTGMLGGLTTFSTFGAETFQLLRAGAVGPAILNIGLQLGLGLAAVALGYHLVAPR